MTNGLFQAHLDTKDAEKAETYRKTKGISKSELVRQALDAYVKEEKEKSPKEKEEIKQEEPQQINLDQLIQQGTA
jgi:hypothetical protein